MLIVSIFLVIKTLFYKNKLTKPLINMKNYYNLILFGLFFFAFHTVSIAQLTIVSVDGIAANPCGSVMPIITLDENTTSVSVVIDIDMANGPGNLQAQHVTTDDFATFATSNGPQFFGPVPTGDGQTFTFDFDIVAACAVGEGMTFNYIQFTLFSNGMNIGQCQFYFNLDCPTLPVDFASFTGERKNKNNLLNWQTASEINNSHFNVERSKNGRNFELIGKVEGSGNTYSSQEYDFVDKNPSTDAFYRLVQVDYDGSSEYSDIIFIDSNFSHFDSGIEIYPNPVNDRLNVQLNNFKDDVLNLSILDITGRIVIIKSINPTNHGNTLDLDLSNLESGAYFVKLTSVGKDIIQKIIKQ